MSLLTGVLPLIRALSEGEMLDIVTIHNAGAVSQSTYGGKAVVPGADVVTVGRVAPLDATDLERVIEGELRQEGLMRLTIPRDVDVSDDATVTVIAEQDGTTTEYTVEAVLPFSTFAVHRKLIVREK